MVVTRERKRLHTWPRRPRKIRKRPAFRFLPPWAPFLVGLAVLCAGLAIMGVGLGLVPVELPASAPPGWVVAAFGWGLALPGLVAVVKIRPELRRDALSQDRLESERSWRDWIADETGKELSRLFYPTLFLAGYLVPFQLVLFGYAIPASGGKGFWPAVIACGFFDLILVGYVTSFIHRGLRRLRFGVTRIRLGRSSCVPGETVDIEFEGGGALAHTTLRAAVRCIAQRLERGGKGGRVSLRLECYRTYEDARDVAAVADIEFAARRIQRPGALPHRRAVRLLRARRYPGARRQALQDVHLSQRVLPHTRRAQADQGAPCP